MATIIDLTLLQSFDFVWAWLIIFSIVFALFQKFKIVGNSPALSAIIGVVAATLVSISDAARQIINFMIPWFSVVIVFFILLLLVFMVFGAKEGEISALVHNKYIVIILLAVVGTIAGVAFFNVFGQDLTSASFPDGSTNVTAASGDVASPNVGQSLVSTLFHPKVLGLIILFGIAIFAILFLTE